jgi:hypothetical protein
LQGLLGLLVPASAALALLVVVTERDRDPDHDLHLIAPESARPGEAIPLRAHLYGDLHRPEGARLLAQPVDVELLARDRRLAQTRLRPGFADTLEGALQLPAGAVGDLTLRASARPRARTTSRVERTLRVSRKPSTMPRRERAHVQPLQRLAAGAISVTSSTLAAPSPFELQIAGGQCVPYHPCTLFVHVGTPPADVFARMTPSVLPERASGEPSGEAGPMRRLRVTTRGPEATFELVAQRLDVVVATRSIRLEVGLGASVLTSLPTVMDEGDPVSIALVGNDAGCIVDAFHEDRWRRSFSLRDCRRGEPVPGPPLEVGAWRLQARRDPFDVQSAAVRTLYVRGSGMSDREVLMALAAHVLELAPDDALARALTPQLDAGLPEPHLDDTGEGMAVALRLAMARQEPYLACFDDAVAYLLAVLDQDVLPLPMAVSGHPAALVELSAKRVRARSLALLTLVVSALCLALLVAHRGLAAAQQAERVMSEAGEEPGALQRQRMRRVLEVVLAVFAVVLVFLAIAAYILARAS